MLNKYTSIAPCDEPKVAPSNDVLLAILNYSKSLEVKKMRSSKKIVLNMN